MPGQKFDRKKILDSQALYNRLKIRSLASETALYKKHPTAAQFFDSIQLRPGQIRQHAAKLLTSGALAGSLLLTAPPAIPNFNAGTPSGALVSSVAPEQLQRLTAESLKATLPPVDQWQLTSDQEKKISQKLKEIYGINAFAQLQDNRLNNSYGRMGAEQHLPRFPGDGLWQHDNLQEKGITPGLGAWGYFASSKEQMTPELYDTEKYYVAVQTLYLPNWNTDTKRLSEWYKFRHVVVVNPANGKTIVAAVADSGPSWWTGKQFGGSPEVMQYLGIDYGMQDHPVVLFFLDDSNKEVPLGPLEYNVEKQKKEMTYKS